MTFRVIILRRAERDFKQILDHIAARSKSGAIAWARAFHKALNRLERDADNFPFAPENDHVDFEVREILFKTRRGLIYRALFSIRADDVLIMHVRGPAQDFMAADEISPA